MPNLSLRQTATNRPVLGGYGTVLTFKGRAARGVEIGSRSCQTKIRSCLTVQIRTKIAIRAGAFQYRELTGWTRSGADL